MVHVSSVFFVLMVFVNVTIIHGQQLDAQSLLMDTFEKVNDMVAPSSGPQPGSPSSSPSPSLSSSPSPTNSPKDNTSPPPTTPPRAAGADNQDASSSSNDSKWE